MYWILLLAVVGCSGAAGTTDDSSLPGTGGGPFSGGAAASLGGAESGGSGAGGRLVGAGGDLPGGGRTSGGAETGGAPGGGGSSAGGSGVGGEAQGAGGGVWASGGTPGIGGAPPGLGPRFPAPGANDQCADPSIRFRFEGKPTLGSSGSLRVFDAQNSGAAVAQINMATSQVTDTIGGTTFKLPRPAFVSGNEAIFLLPSAGLSYGHTYYVTVDSGVVRGPDNETIAVSDPSEWRFTVASAAPSNKSELSVAVDGTGQFCSVQGALNAATTGSHIRVASGVYYGVIYFKGKDNITLSGAGRDTTRIAGINNNNLNPSTRTRALFGTEGVSGFALEDITIVNETPQDGSQAEALAMLSCDKCIVRNSTIRSLQDTLLWSGRIYAEDSRVEGNVDYIWGTGTAYFNRVEVKTIGRKGYNVQARNSNSNYGYVFVDSKLTADAGVSGDVLARIDVSAYPASHVAYINCEMGSHISPAGWAITGGGSTTGLRFWEYQSRDPSGELLDTKSRAAGSKQLNQTEANQMRDASIVLGGWDPR